MENALSFPCSLALKTESCENLRTDLRNTIPWNYKYFDVWFFHLNQCKINREIHYNCWTALQMNNPAFQFSTEAWTQTKNLRFYLNPDTMFFHKPFLTVFGGCGGGWFVQKFLFTNPGILIDGDWKTNFAWLGIPSRSKCCIKAYLVPRMSDDHFLSFQFWIWKQSFKYKFLRPCNHYIVKKILKFHFTFQNKWKNSNIETEQKKNDHHW